MRLGISEILDQASKQPTVQDRANFLRQHQSQVLWSILKYAMDPSIVFMLPEGAPPYKPNPYPAQELRLYAENRRLYIFIQGQGPQLHTIKREHLFIEILESVSPLDAQLLIAMKDKKLNYPKITHEVVELAFPGLIPQPIEQTKDEAPTTRPVPERDAEDPEARPEAKAPKGSRRGTKPRTQGVEE